MASVVQLIMWFLLVFVQPISVSSVDYAKNLESILQQLDYTLVLHLRSSEDYEHHLVRFLLRQQTVPLKLQLGEQVLPTLASSVAAIEHHLFIYADSEELQRKYRHFRHCQGFYIVSLEKIPPDTRQLLQFMDSIWRRYDHNRIYYVLQQTQQLVLYNPFTNNVVPVEHSQSFEDIFSNLHGYPLRAYIFDSVYSALYGDDETQEVLRVTGPDAKAAEAVARQLNFTLNYMWPDDEFFGSRQANGSFSGAVGRAHRNELDVIFAGFFIKDYLSTRIQFSAAVYMDDLCLFVQKAQRIPQSIVPLFAVRVDVWLCFFLVGFVCAFIWLCLRFLNLGLHIECIEGSHVQQPVTNLSIAWRLFIDTWVVWVRVNVGQFPPYNSERIFLASLCLVSVIFGALLESSLATAYIRPLYYRDPNTLAELDESRIPIYIKHPAFKDDLFVGHDSEVYRRLDAKMLLVGEGEDRLISMVAKDGKFAGVTRSASLELSDRRFIMTHKVHKIPECPKTYHIGYVLPKPSPYVEHINKVLLQLLAGGLLDFWISEMKEQAKMSIYRYPEYLAELSVGKWKVFTLKDVQLAFYALAIGCALSVMVWFMELWLKQ